MKVKGLGSFLHRRRPALHLVAASANCRQRARFPESVWFVPLVPETLGIVNFRPAYATRVFLVLAEKY